MVILTASNPTTTTTAPPVTPGGPTETPGTANPTASKHCITSL